MKKRLGEEPNYSICSRTAFVLSGRSLNLVDFVNGGGPAFVEVVNVFC